jgi:hypothetical protein
VSYGQQGKFAWTLQAVTTGVKVGPRISERARLYQLKTAAGQHASQIFSPHSRTWIDFE